MSLRYWTEERWSRDSFFLSFLSLLVSSPPRRQRRFRKSSPWISSTSLLVSIVDGRSRRRLYRFLSPSRWFSSKETTNSLPVGGSRRSNRRFLSLSVDLVEGNNDCSPYRWLSSRMEDGDLSISGCLRGSKMALSLSWWLSETKTNGDCFSRESKGKASLCLFQLCLSLILVREP